MKQTIMVTRDREGNIESIKLFPEEIEIVLTEAQLKTFDLLNEKGILHLIDSNKPNTLGQIHK